MELSCFWQPVTIKALQDYGSWSGFGCGMPRSMLVILLFSLALGKLLLKHVEYVAPLVNLMSSRMIILSSILSSIYCSAR